MLQGFKKFILRGNVVDLAVAVVIGAAFSKVVSGFTGDFITPLLSFFGSNGKWANNSWTVGIGHHMLHFHHQPLVFKYGDFIEQLINFLLTAVVLYFFVVLPVNKLIELSRKKEPTPDPTTRKCPDCLSEVPLLAKRCMYCTSTLKPVKKSA